MITIDQPVMNPIVKKAAAQIKTRETCFNHRTGVNAKCSNLRSKIETLVLILRSMSTKLYQVSQTCDLESMLYHRIKTRDRHLDHEYNTILDFKVET